MYHIVYLTTNLINGKQYIGDHSANLIKDSYIGSGVLITKAIKKYGKQFFKREILDFFNTKEEAFNAQEKFINEYNTLVPNGYNVSPKGGHQVKNSFNDETIKKLKNRIVSEDTKQKMREAHKKRKYYANGHKLSDETREKIKKSWEKRRIEKPLSDESRKKMSLSRMGKKNSFYGKHHTEKTKEKLRNISKDYMKTEEYRENMSESVKGTKNGMYGKHHSEESKKKMSLTRKKLINE